MSKTRLIYFLAAFVLLIGCLALNTSYSLFVQTETINNVDSYVPTLAYSLGDTDNTIENIVIKANTTEFIKIKVNNLGSTNIKYILSLKEKIEGVNVNLVDLESNNNVGSLENQSSKYIWFKIENNNLEDKEITFTLYATYYTLNITEELIQNTNIDSNNLYEINIKDTILFNTINNSLNTKDLSKTIYIEDINLVEENNNRPLLLNTEDIYTATTSNKNYYFNGNVIDNYIDFAGMCWRIVSIQGDNSIKLILEDIDNICAESNGNYAIPIQLESNEQSSKDNNVVNNKEEILYNGTYGYITNDNKQIILNYLTPSENIKDISMSNVFKKFANNFTDHLQYMKTGDWCLNNNLYEDEQGENLVGNINQYDNTLNKLYYNDYINIKNNIISLKCNEETINKYNDATEMYVGALNINEIYLAGLSENQNSNNYLMNNYSRYNESEENIYKGINFWTLSPSYFDGLRSYAYSVNAKGNVVNSDLYSNDIVFRPSIILGANNKIISGNGTLDNSYKIIIETELDEKETINT